MNKKLIAALVAVAAVAVTGCGPTTTGSSGPAVTIDAERVEEAVPAEWRNALRKADTYANRMNMSKQAVYDQLVSEHGERFPADAAQYAIDHVEADWKANALAKAKTYQDGMGMSREAIRQQLASPYGEKFSEEEADWAVANL